MGSTYADFDAIDLRLCAEEHFVSLREGFATFDGFVEAFRIAQFAPKVIMKVGDIFSLMNLVSGGIGYSLLPGRVRDVFKDKVQLIPLQRKYLMRQIIGLSFMHARGRDPNILLLASVCRMAHRGAPAPAPDRQFRSKSEAAVTVSSNTGVRAECLDPEREDIRQQSRSEIVAGPR
jgi:LysR family malonate utilization transcriptional regulator